MKNVSKFNIFLIQMSNQTLYLVEILKVYLFIFVFLYQNANLCLPKENILS